MSGPIPGNRAITEAIALTRTCGAGAGYNVVIDITA